MTRFLIVAAGGALGSMARYGVGVLAGRLMGPSAWPWGTLSVNIIGGLLMGALTGWLAFRGGAQAESLRLFTAVGVLGGFTTFSAFSLETADDRTSAVRPGRGLCRRLGCAVGPRPVYRLMVARRAFGAAP